MNEVEANTKLFVKALTLREQIWNLVAELVEDRIEPVAFRAGEFPDPRWDQLRLLMRDVRELEERV